MIKLDELTIDEILRKLLQPLTDDQEDGLTENSSCSVIFAAPPYNVKFNYITDCPWVPYEKSLAKKKHLPRRKNRSVKSNRR